MSLLLTILAAPALAAASPLAPATADSPVVCLWAGYRNKEWDVLVPLVRAGMNPQTNDQRILLDKIRVVSDNCRKRYGWGKKRQDLALRYFAGRVLATDSTYQLKHHGLDYPKLKAVVDALDAPTRRAYVDNKVTADQSAATFAALKAAGIDFDLVPDEEKPGFARALSQGVLGLVIEQQAEADYAEA